MRLLKQGAKTIFHSKTDLKSTFYLVQCKPEDFALLLLKAPHPVTGEIAYFFDKNLPFWGSISCSLFQTFSDSLQHIVQFLIGHPWTCTNYDYLFVHEMEQACNMMVRTFLDLCECINCPISAEKTEWAMQRITFLGVILDSNKMILGVHEVKCQKAINLLKWVIVKR